MSVKQIKQLENVNMLDNTKDNNNERNICSYNGASSDTNEKNIEITNEFINIIRKTTTPSIINTSP